MTLSTLRGITAAVAAGCLAIAGASFGQTYSTPPDSKSSAQPSKGSTTQSSTPSQSAPSSGTSMQPNTPTQPGASAGMASTIPSKSEPAASAFGKLDKSQQGYVTKAETAGLTGFDAAFAKGDANHDGKLSKAEFEAAWTAYAAAK